MYVDASAEIASTTSVTAHALVDRPEDVTAELGLSIYARSSLLNHYFGRATFTQPTIYVALLTEDGVEISGTGYARVQTAASDWTVASGGITSNAADITYPNPTQRWGAVGKLALYDAASGGHLLGAGNLATTRTVNSGLSAPPYFAAGDITVTMSGSCTVAVCNSLLDHLFGKSSLTPLTACWLTMTDADDNEPTAGEYARQELVPADWLDADYGILATATAVEFPTPVEAWGLMEKSMLYDAATAGNWLASGDLPYPRQVTIITPAPVYAAGSVRVLLT